MTRKSHLTILNILALAGMTVLLPVAVRASDPASAQTPASVNDSSLRFLSQGYILDETMPPPISVASKNASHIFFSIWKITDPKTVVRLYRNRSAQLVDEADSAAFLQEAGTEIWHGSVSVGPSTAEVVTPLALDALKGEERHGAYAIVARTNEKGPAQAIQWLILGDMVASAIADNGSLHAFLTTRQNGNPIAGAKLVALDSRDEEVGEAITNSNGYASIEITQGVTHPVTLYAQTHEGDIAIIDLGQMPEAKPDLFLWSAQAAWHSGDTIELLALARDSNGKSSDSLEKGEVRLYRPDKMLVATLPLLSLGDGGYKISYTLPPHAVSGLWHAEIYKSDSQDIVKSIDLQVLPKYRPAIQAPLAVKIEKESLDRDGAISFSVTPSEARQQKKHIHDPAARIHYPLSATITLSRKNYISGSEVEGFSFGNSDDQPLSQDSKTVTQFIGSGNPVKLAINVKLPRPFANSSASFVRINVDLRDAIGQRFSGQEDLSPQGRGDAAMIGIKPEFADRQLPENATANFQIGRFSQKGIPQRSPSLHYELFQNHFDYQWYAENGAWKSRAVSAEQTVSSGAVDFTGAASSKALFADLHLPVQSGRYRLVVTDPDTGRNSSLSFTAGWWLSPQRGPMPDLVEVTPMRQEVEPGGKIWIFVRPPWPATVSLHFLSHGITDFPPREISGSGAFIEVITKPEWHRGSLIVAEARPVSPEVDSSAELRPRRALGEAWMPLNDNNPQPESTVEFGPLNNAQPGEIDQIIHWTTSLPEEKGHFAWFMQNSLASSLLKDGPGGEGEISRKMAQRLTNVIDGSEAAQGFISGSDGDARIIDFRNIENPDVAEISSAPNFEDDGIYVAGSDGQFNDKGSAEIAIPAVSGRNILKLFAWSRDDISVAAKIYQGDKNNFLMPNSTNWPEFLNLGDTIRVESDAKGDIKSTITVETLAEKGLVIAPHTLSLSPRRFRGIFELSAQSPGYHSFFELSRSGDATLKTEHDIFVFPSDPQIFSALKDMPLRLLPGAHYELQIPEASWPIVTVGPLPDFGLPWRLVNLYRAQPEDVALKALRGRSLLRWRQSLLDAGITSSQKLALQLAADLGDLTQSQKKDGSFLQPAEEESSVQEISTLAEVINWLWDASQAQIAIPAFTRANAVRRLQARLSEENFPATEWLARAEALVALSRQKELPAAIVRRYAADAPADIETAAALSAALSESGLSEDISLWQKRLGQALKISSGASMACPDFMFLAGMSDRLPQFAKSWLLANADKAASSCARLDRNRLAQDAKILIGLSSLEPAAHVSAEINGSSVAADQTVVRMPSLGKKSLLSLFNAGTEPLYIGGALPRRFSDLQLSEKSIPIASASVSLDAPDDKALKAEAIGIYRITANFFHGVDNKTIRFEARLPTACHFLDPDSGEELGNQREIILQIADSHKADSAASFVICDQSGSFVIPEPLALDGAIVEPDRKTLRRVDIKDK